MSQLQEDQESEAQDNTDKCDCCGSQLMQNGCCASCQRDEEYVNEKIFGPDN